MNRQAPDAARTSICFINRADVAVRWATTRTCVTWDSIAPPRREISADPTWATVPHVTCKHKMAAARPLLLSLVCGRLCHRVLDARKG